jgi:hypothetical protein
MKRAFLQATSLLLIANCAGAAPCIQPGFYSGVDLLFLSPKISDIGITNIFFFGEVPAGAEFGGSFDSPLEFAQRVFVGYQGDQGGGARVRWFTFDNDLDYVGEWENGGPELELIGTANLDVDAIDAELTQIGAFRNWTWMGSAGVRYGRVNLSETINFEDIPAAVFEEQTGVNFEGAGPTLSVEGARPFLMNGISIFANARTSLLFGDIDLRSSFVEDGLVHINNEFAQVWEFQAGTRARIPLTQTVDLFGGIFWEAQRWDSDTGLLGDLAFHGFGAQFGFFF